MNQANNFQVKGKTFLQLTTSSMTESSDDPYFCIPRYQRQYTWEPYLALQLLGDVYEYFCDAFNHSGESNEKFIGSFIIVESENAKLTNTSPELVYDVIDGQQRLTTMSLTAAAAIYHLLELGKDIYDEACALLELEQDETYKNDLEEQLFRVICRSLPGYINKRILLFSGHPGISTDFAPRIYREREDADPKSGKPLIIDLSKDTPNSVMAKYYSPAARFFFHFAKASEQFLSQTQKYTLKDQNFYTKALEVLAHGKSYLVDEITNKITYRTNYQHAYDFLVELGKGMKEKPIDKYPFNVNIPTENMLEPRSLSESIHYDFFSDNSLRVFRENFQDLQKLISKSKLEEIRNSKISEILNSIVRVISYLEYFTTKVNIAVISGTRNTALDIFETINTAGQPLDSIETFIPEIYQTIKLLDSNSTNKENFLERKHSFGAINNKNLEEILKEIQTIFNNEKNRDGVSQVIIWFALICFGHKVGKKFQVQRWELKKAFDLFISKNTCDWSPDISDSIYTWQKVHEFTCLLLTVSKWWVLCYGTPNSKVDLKSRFKGNWFIETQLLPIPDGKKNLSDRQKKDLDIANFCLSFLKSANQSVSIGLAGRYYIQYVKNPSADNFSELIKAIKAIAAFTALWLSGEKGSSQYAETQRRTMTRISETQIKGQRQIFSNLSYFSQYEEDNYNKNYRIKAQSIMDSFVTGYEAFNSSFSLETWIAKLAYSELAYSRKAVNRFLLILYWYCSENSTDSSLGLRKKVIKPLTNFLTGEYWEILSSLELEHIVPTKCDKWNIDLRQAEPRAKRILNELGNTTLLPKKLNVYASNNTWEYKKLLYSMLSARSKSDFENIWKQADLYDSSVTIKEKNAIKRQLESLNDDISEANTFLVESLLEIENWSCNIIETRTKCMATIIWPLLSSWLGQDETFNEKFFNQYIQECIDNELNSHKSSTSKQQTQTDTSKIDKFSIFFDAQILENLSSTELLINNEYGYLHITTDNKLLTVDIINRTRGKHRIRENPDKGNFKGKKSKIRFKLNNLTERGFRYTTDNESGVNWLIDFISHHTKLFNPQSQY